MRDSFRFPAALLTGSGAVSLLSGIHQQVTGLLGYPLPVGWAVIPARNVRHICPVRLGAGSMPASLRICHTLECERGSA